jgi:hypothetical protein
MDLAAVARGHTKDVLSVAVSQDGHIAVSGGRDGTVRVWALDWDYEFPETAELASMLADEPAHSGCLTDDIKLDPGPTAPTVTVSTPEPAVLAFRHAVRSDRGLYAGSNEDSLYVGASLLVVADGEGVEGNGDAASQLVIAALCRLEGHRPRGDLRHALADAVADGSAAIADAVKGDAELNGVGTRVTALLLRDRQLALVHVGNSRGYLLCEGRLTHLTDPATPATGPEPTSRGGC